MEHGPFRIPHHDGPLSTVADGPMHNQADHFAKNLTRDSLSRASLAETEVEVMAATQKIDIYSVPDPARAARRAEMGLLGALSAEPAIFEPYRRTPTLRLVRQCLRKQLTWFHELERRARAARGGRRATVPEDEDEDAPDVPFPALVIVSPGRPETALDLLGFLQEQQGVYRNAPGFRMRIVILAELPRTRATLMLRLLGSGQVFRHALADLEALPAGAWEKGVATPLLVHFRLRIDDEPAPQEDEMNEDIRAWWEEYQRNEQRLRDQARSDGERKMLLRQLRARFGELPAGALARIEAAGEADLERWGDRVLHAQTLADVLDAPS